MDKIGQNKGDTIRNRLKMAQGMRGSDVDPLPEIIPEVLNP